MAVIWSPRDVVAAAQADEVQAADAVAVADEQNGGTSLFTAQSPDIITIRPMRQNWWITAFRRGECSPLAMAGEGGAVDHDNAVADDAIVGDVGVDHHETLLPTRVGRSALVEAWTVAPSRRKHPRR